MPRDPERRYPSSDVSAMMAAMGNDIFVIDGGMVKVPGPVYFHFNVDFSSGMPDGTNRATK